MTRPHFRATLCASRIRLRVLSNRRLNNGSNPRGFKKKTNMAKKTAKKKTAKKKPAKKAAAKKATGKKKPAGKKKGGKKKGAADFIISKSRTKAAAGINVSSDFYGALDSAVRCMIDAAEARACENGRKTLRPHDL